jgi:hypothetical protein
MYHKTLTILYKIFFIWLLAQFFLQTFVTYKLWMDMERMKYVWLRKEAIIWIIWLLALGNIIRRKDRKQIIATPTLGRRTLWLIISVALAACIHILLLGQPIWTFILAFKYDFFGFFILLVGLHSAWGISEASRQEILVRYGRVIKRSLVGALVWYAVIFIKPGTLKLFGYDNFMYEWSVSVQPPAAYYTLINHGVTRNQFLFERPISWWFFLTAFFPFFFMLFLHKKPLRNTRTWRTIYGVNVLFTFSRAAWGSWIIELIGIWLFVYRKDIKKFMFYILLPIVIVLWWLWAVAYQSVFQRSYSTNWHIEMLQNWTKLYMKSPLLGHGWWRAGPASHREWWPKFNPENQFLQILIEFGLLWFLPRFLVYLTLNLIWFHHVVASSKKKIKTLQQKNTTLFLAAMSLWMVGLSASWMLLHSFSDRMIVYPLMLIFGIVWMQFIKTSTI